MEKVTHKIPVITKKKILPQKIYEAKEMVQQLRVLPVFLLFVFQVRLSLPSSAALELTL